MRLDDRYEVDDSHTSRVHDTSQLKTSAAYLLVYVQQSELGHAGWIPAADGLDSMDFTLGDPAIDQHTLEVTPAYTQGISVSPDEVMEYIKYTCFNLKLAEHCDVQVDSSGWFNMGLDGRRTSRCGLRASGGELQARAQ